MPRTHLLILAFGVLLALLAALHEAPPEASTELVPTDHQPRVRHLGEPDLYLETADIHQFTSQGTLAYRIRANSIVRYPQAHHTLLDAPRLTFYQTTGNPWELSAEHGSLIADSGLPDADLLPAPGSAQSAGERIKLEDDVRVQRHHGDGGLIELQTEALTLFPDRQYATTKHPVIMRSQSGRTTAEGLHADFASGIFSLGAPAGRVHTVIFPGEP